MSVEIGHTPPIKIIVTQEDISVALPKNSGHCMIADAVKRDFLKKFKRKPLGVAVDLQTIRMTDVEKGLRYIYLTPRIGQIQLLRFDKGLEIKPFVLFLRGGQIVASKSHPHHGSPNDKKYEAKRNEVKKLKRARLRMSKGKAGMTITKIGGESPPIALLSGKRREFGLNISEKDLQAING